MPFFVLLGGVRMSLEAVEYVKEAEERAKQIEINGDNKIKDTTQQLQKRIDEEKTLLSNELIEYETKEQQKYDALLAKEKEAIDNEVTIELETLRVNVKKYENQVASDIVKEVIDRYGNR